MGGDAKGARKSRTAASGSLATERRTPVAGSTHSVRGPLLRTTATGSAVRNEYRPSRASRDALSSSSRYGRPSSSSQLRTGSGTGSSASTRGDMDLGLALGFRRAWGLRLGLFYLSLLTF